MAVISKARFESYLNWLGIPELERKSNGGRVPDFVKYGSWLRRKDPISFEVGYQEWKLNKQ